MAWSACWPSGSRRPSRRRRRGEDPQGTPAFLTLPASSRPPPCVVFVAAGFMVPASRRRGDRAVLRPHRTRSLCRCAGHRCDSAVGPEISDGGTMGSAAGLARLPSGGDRGIAGRRAAPEPAVAGRLCAQRLRCAVPLREKRPRSTPNRPVAVWRAVHLPSRRRALLHRPDLPWRDDMDPNYPPFSHSEEYLEFFSLYLRSSVESPLLLLLVRSQIGGEIQ